MFKLINLNVKSTIFPAEVSTLQEQKDGSYFVGLLFAEKSLLKLSLDDQGNLKDMTSLDIESEFDADYLGITGGLRGTSTGDTAFATLHKGSAGLMGLFKKAGTPKNQDELWEDLSIGKGSYGFSYKHSIVQIVDGAFKLRRVKEPGVLLDVAHIGDFIFGLSGNTVFREPYLNSEKRYFLREDLETNYRLHKVEDGLFWLAGDQSRMMKLGLMDNKALPTTKKLPDLPMRASSDSAADGWLYAVAGKSLFRVRVNTENKLDELQLVKTFESGVPLSVTCTELEVGEGEPRKAKIWVSVAQERSTQLYSFETTRPEDMEDLPPAPELKKEWDSGDVLRLSNLSYSKKHGLVGSCFNTSGEAHLFLG
ncbi:MAG: hypothetical protein R3A80_04600 [Bdellovibrionota bacterium]